MPVIALMPGRRSGVCVEGLGSGFEREGFLHKALAGWEWQAVSTYMTLPNHGVAHCGIDGVCAGQRKWGVSNATVPLEQQRDEGWHSSSRHSSSRHRSVSEARTTFSRCLIDHD